MIEPPRRHVARKERWERGEWRIPAIAILAMLGVSVSAQTGGEGGGSTGLARAEAPEFAEYPVPAHILKLSDTLNLTEEQIKQIEAISDGMNAAAQELGIRIIANEEHLQELFLSGSAQDAEADSVAAVIVGLRGKLRSLNRRANTQADGILTRRQRSLYQALRLAREEAMPGGGR